MRAGMKVTLSIAATGLIVAVGYFGFDSYEGKRLVRELCAKGSGLTIHETTYANGYLDLIEDGMYCSACFERLAKRQFEYIDVKIPGDPATTHPLAIRPGYYRLTLTSRGDPRCELWGKNINLARWAELQRNVGVNTAQQCVAVSPLPELPDEAVLTRERGAVPGDHFPYLEYDVFALRNTRSHQTLAEIREYLHFSRWGLIFNWAPIEASGKCQTFDRRLGDLLTFQSRILRDRTKMPISLQP